jgi:hypothetical protein
LTISEGIFLTTRQTFHGILCRNFRELMEYLGSNWGNILPKCDRQLILPLPPPS